MGRTDRAACMTWTTDKPTQPGLYKYRPPHGRGLIVFYHVAQDGPQLVVMKLGSLVREAVEEKDGEWFGPIPIPTE